ncbi:uncharacterized protein SCHCODRAFT_01047318, partial [Schizophyllum commune H4-8]
MAATQLVEVGLFPCAPYRPSIAIDINILDFARLLFLNISPNVTAWCKATEAFLMSRAHKLQYSDNLRKRFGYALLWYSHLRNLVDAHVERVLASARETMGFTPPSSTPLATAPTPSDGDPPSSPTPAAPRHRRDNPGVTAGDHRRGSPDPASDVDDDLDSTNDADERLRAPSAYLRGRCPACFG